MSKAIRVLAVSSLLMGCRLPRPEPSAPEPALATDLADPMARDSQWSCVDLRCDRVALPDGEVAVDQLLADLEARCASDQRNACMLGGIVEERRRNWSTALRLHLRACELGHPSGCSRAGFMMTREEWGQHDPERGFDLLRRACEEMGEGYGCAQLGAKLEWVDGDVEGALPYYERACASPSGGLGCLYLAELHLKGKGVPHDPARARELLTDSCAEGAPAACAGLAERSLADGDHSRALTLATQSCEQGSARGCTILGILTEQGFDRSAGPEGGDTRPADKDRAAHLYDLACSAGDSLGCTYLATAHVGGWFAGADPARGRELYERECRRGVSNACGWYALMLIEGKAGPKDSEAGAALAIEVCSTKHEPRSCTIAGMSLISGIGVELDVERGLALLVEACEQGTQDACRVLEQIEPAKTRRVSPSR